MPKDPLLFGRTTGGCGARYDGTLKKHGLPGHGLDDMVSTFSLQDYESQNSPNQNHPPHRSLLLTVGFAGAWGEGCKDLLLALGIGAVANIRSADCRQTAAGLQPRFESNVVDPLADLASRNEQAQRFR